MTTWWFRACPVCSGDLFSEDDNPHEWDCLQCARSFVRAKNRPPEPPTVNPRVHRRELR